MQLNQKYFDRHNTTLKLLLKETTNVKKKRKSCKKRIVKRVKHGWFEKLTIRKDTFTEREWMTDDRVDLIEKDMNSDIWN